MIPRTFLIRLVMTREEAVALLERYSNYDGMGIPNLAGCKEAMRVAVDALKEACPELAESEDLEEAARRYSDGPECSWVGKSALEYAFIAGAEWQKSQMPMPEDTVIFMKGVAEGRRLEREEREENKRKEDELPRFYGD